MKRLFDANLMRASVLAGVFLVLSPARAADVSAFSAAKGHVFQQSSAAAPVAQFVAYVFRATVEGNLDAITGATVQGPSAFAGAMEIPPNDAGTRLELSVPFPDLTSMGFLFGNGDYRFTFDTENSGFDLAQVTLNSTTFPTAVPQISNYDAAQSIDPASDFTVNFNGLGDAGSFALVITGDDGEVLAESGTGTSVTIPAGTLSADASYTGRLRFVKEIDRDIQSVAGAVGTAELFNETEFTLAAGEGGGGGTDTLPPFLFATSPTSGTTGVGINSKVSFTFSEPMAATQSIEWGASVNASLFTYAWTAGGRTLEATYTGNLPANANISWKLNPTAANPGNFKDLAGNQLPSNVFTGSFTTGSGVIDPNDPCGPNPVDDGRGFGNIAKGAYFLQTGNNPPIVDAEMAGVFSGTYRGASNQNVTAVTLTGPAGTKTFQNLAGFYFLSEEFSSAAALDAGIPAGNYTLNATGAGSATLTVGNVAQIPVPRIINLNELNSMNVANPFTLNFSAFTGASANDSIFISITGGEGDGEFQAPDICRNIQLLNTATSVTIPANTFKTGKSFTGTITFSRNGSFDTNSIPGTTVSSSASTTTRFGFSTGGGQPPTAPRWTTIRRNANGTISFFITADAGAQLTIEGAGAPGTWNTETTATVTGGSYEFIVNPNLAPRRLYRAKIL